MESEKNIICLENHDKDGAIVSARIASLTGKVACGRPLEFKPAILNHKDYFRDTADKFAGLYDNVTEKSLLRHNNIVLSSVHRAALYIAEVLHAPVLPLQILSFSKSLEECLSSDLLSIAGADYDLKAIWQWNKITKVSDFPLSYIKMIEKAENVFVVRSTDNSDDCPIVAKSGNVFFNSTIKSIYPDLWNGIKDRLDRNINNLPELKQWEWGLPDLTVEACRKLWSGLGKDQKNFHVIEDSTVGLYKMIPHLWEKYLLKNNVRIKGLTFNSYWIAHPYYERYAGLIPISFYKFQTVKHIADNYLKKYPPENSYTDLCAFVNGSGSMHDVESFKEFLSEFNIAGKCWFSVGFDSRDSICIDAFGEKIPNPYQKISEWIEDAPYRHKKWVPLDEKFLC
jgi:hypothetical protein